MNSLIPSTFSASTSVFEIPPIPIQSPNQIIKRGEQPADSGLFSSFTSYLAGYAADDPPEPSDQELADTLATVDCLNACPMEEIFANVMSLHPEAMVGLVDALLEHLPQNGSPVVAVVKGEPGTPAQKSNNNRGPPKSTYNPTVVYLLEFASMLAVRDVETAAIVGKDVVEALQDVIRDASHLHPIIISRAVYYLLNLLNACHVSLPINPSCPQSS
jgi:brefeldin A-resistance guanine nucleotide exchange factor 1